MKTAKMEPWQIEDARRLRQLWEEKKPASQEKFGADYKIGNQSMVGHYLLGKTPLNHAAVGKFARGLNVLIDDISPTLADQIRELYALCDARKNTEFGVSPEARKFVEETVRRMMQEGRGEAS